MAQKAETRFSNRVHEDLVALERMNYLWFTKVQQVSIRGVPDYLICAGGVFVGLELKRADGIQPDALQTYNLRKIKIVGGFSFTANPDNWNEIYSAIVDTCKVKKTLKSKLTKSK